MNTRHSWITPFMKQCYVTAGVSLNMMSHGLVTGFSAVLLPQLRASGSPIKVDETSESWIASVFSITFIVGSFIGSVLMSTYGRKKANLISITIMAVGWYVTVWSSSVTLLLVSRIIQGLSLGISIHLGPTMIGEYTSPRNRGAFLATINFAVSGGILATHTLGSYLKWQTTALICAIIITIDFLIVFFSPETPTWLMDKGKYEECKVVFRGLRGLDEEEELTRMIRDNVIAQSKTKKEYESLLRKFLTKFRYFKATMLKEEFYKPSLIIMHLYTLGQWGGASILAQFMPDIITFVVGDNIDAAKMTVMLAIHRFVSGIYISILISKFKRRTMVISLSSVTVISILAIAGYAYARPTNVLFFDHPAIGIVLIHIHMVCVCSGTLALGFVMAGEIFPLEYKSLAGGLSATAISVNVFILAKTGPYLFGTIGIPITYSIYAAVAIYSLVIVIMFLPETKGRTLQDIEDGFRKNRPLEKVETSEPLTDK